MSTKAPNQWKSVANALPIIQNVISWEPIREWALSSVHRVVLSHGLPAIAKRSSGLMMGELELYQSVLTPLGIEHAEIYAGIQTDSACFMLMKDLGSETLETRPSNQYFIAAAKKLARIHSTAAKGIQENRIVGEILSRRCRQPQAFMDDAKFLEGSVGIDDAGQRLMHEIVRFLPQQLESLYSKFPMTLVHSDYYAKNLVIGVDDVHIIDWTNAYFSPHLGDVYGLGREARNIGMDTSEIYLAYCTAVGDSLGDPDSLLWRAFLGGVCWSVQSIRWVLTDGINIIPGAETWVPDMINDLREAVERLQERMCM